jgi:hypothetical protein
MRGRPRCLLLRRLTPLAAVLAVLGPSSALAGSPAPDAPPPAPSALAPDPAPEAHPAITTPAARPTYVAPTVRPVAPPAKHAVVKAAKPKPKPEPKARPHRPVAETRFVIPRIALPASIAAASARTLHTLDAVLAGLALLAAAGVAGSGARLVAVWNRREAA